MALSNESYIVNTTTVGEVIVPVKGTVSYLNINFLGYQHFSYHSIMSQNIANIVDDIKVLQDGGLAQATFDLDGLIADAKLEIDTQITAVEGGINLRIEDYTTQILEETQLRLDNFDITINGDINTLSMRAAIQAQTDIIGDDNSGIIKKMNTIESNNIINNNLLTGYSNTVTVLVDEAQVREDIVKSLVNTVDTATTGLYDRTVVLETIVGNVNGGLVSVVYSNRDMIFGNGSYEGLHEIIGDNTKGLILYSNNTRILLNNFKANIDPRMNTLELLIGIDSTNNTLTSGLLQDVVNIQTNTNNVSNTIGSDDSSGIRLRIFTLEQFDSQQIRNSLYTNATTGTGLVEKVTTLTNDLINLDNDYKQSDTTIITSLALTETKAQTNLETNNAQNITISEHETKISDHEIRISENKTDLGDMVDDIRTQLLTFEPNTNPIVFSPAKLREMDINITSSSLDGSIINTRFVSYFGNSTAPIPKDEIGLESLNKWLVDTSTNGFNNKVDVKVASAITSLDSSIDQITTNENAITKLNDNETIVGSIKHTIDLLSSGRITDIESDITLIDSDETVAGSVDYKILTSITDNNTNLHNDYINPIIQTAQLNIEKIDNINNNIFTQVNDMQLEFTRYTTILPFLSKMFKYINTPGSITNDEIDNITDSILDDLKANQSVSLSSDKFELDTVNNEFIIHIRVDNDLTIINLPDIVDSNIPSNNIFRIVRDNDLANTVVAIDTDVDANNGFLILSNKFINMRIINEISDGATTFPIATTTSDDQIFLQYKTVDMFGNETLMKLKLKEI